MKKFFTVLGILALGAALGRLFDGAPPRAEAGQEPACAPLLVTGGGVLVQDMNGDGVFDPITEAVRLLSWAFLGAPAPPAPCDPPELTARIEELEAYLSTCQGDLNTSTAQVNQLQMLLQDCRSGARLPDSGQTRCFDQSGGEVPCDDAACSGQDGLYPTGCTSEGRFVVNDGGTPEDTTDDTVTNTCTGLTWQRETAPGAYTWCDALAYCENLSFAGHDDFHEKALEVKGELGGPRPL